MLPAGEKLRFEESNNSAVGVPPPATSSLPFINMLAVWPLRAVLMLSVTTKPDDIPPTEPMTEEVMLKLTELDIPSVTPSILS